MKRGAIFRLLLLLIGVFVFSCVRVPVRRVGQTINPLQFGINEARTGTERYYVLQRTHQAAVKQGMGVSYSGIKEIKLDIPPDAMSLPLTHYTDFAGVTLIVTNKHKNFFLFSLSNKLKPVKVLGEEIDKHDFGRNPILKKVRALLVISDKTPWVEKRIGYNYGATRKDVLLLDDGKSVDGPIMSYCSTASNPECGYCEVGMGEKVIKDVAFVRDGNSTKKTYLVKVENQYNVKISKVSLETPDGSGLYADKAIEIVNCVDVTLDDVTINGTYSLPKQYGYGVSMDNINNLQVKDMYARANWGVFGNNNIHKARLQNCDINRFDIHCYGKDVHFESCNFVGFYNQFSSIYGEVVFNNCTFTEFTPVLIEGTYNALTAFDIVFENCTINLDKNHTSIFTIYGFSKQENPRPELKQKCLPNISLRNCEINVAEDVNKWYFYNTNNIGDYKGRFSYISKVSIEGDSKYLRNKNMSFFSRSFNSVNKIQCNDYSKR